MDLINLQTELRKFVSQFVTVTEEHLFKLLNSIAEERYSNIEEQRPEYIHTIPLQYIASFLGVSL